MSLSDDLWNAMMLEEGYYNTLDGKLYREGDIVPIYQYDSGTAYCGTVIKIIKPGFAGLVRLDKKVTGGHDVVVTYDDEIPDEHIVEWVQLPVDPDPSCFIIAPEPVAWRWSYAMQEIMKHNIVQRGINSIVDEDGTEWKMEE